MIRCLLVTGDQSVRDLVKAGLDQTQSFAVDFAQDSWARELVRSTDYRVVIADGTLADGSEGVELLAEVRRILPDSELVLLTRSRTQSRYLAREKQSVGIHAFLQIPVEPRAFFKAIGGLVKKVVPNEKARA